MHRECRKRFPRYRFQRKPACITACTCHDACRDSLSEVAGKTFPAFPAHAQPTILRIWWETHNKQFSKPILHKLIGISMRQLTPASWESTMSYCGIYIAPSDGNKLVAVDMLNLLADEEHFIFNCHRSIFAWFSSRTQNITEFWLCFNDGDRGIILGSGK